MVQKQQPFSSFRKAAGETPASRVPETGVWCASGPFARCASFMQTLQIARHEAVNAPFFQKRQAPYRQIV